MCDDICGNNEAYDFTKYDLSGVNLRIVGNGVQRIKLSITPYCQPKKLELLNVIVLHSEIVKTQEMIFRAKDCVFKGQCTFDIAIDSGKQDLSVSYCIFEDDFETNLFRPYVKVLNKSRLFNDETAS